MRSSNLLVVARCYNITSLWYKITSRDCLREVPPYARYESTSDGYRVASAPPSRFYNFVCETKVVLSQTFKDENNMKKQFVLALALSAFVLTGCEEDPIIPTWKNDGGAQPINITSFYPESGEGGIVMYIFGENFGTSESNVTFNGIHSDVLQVQPGKITVRVPLNLGQGDYEINLSARGQKVTSTTRFKVTGEKVN